jgi:uncharacterized membrane protein
MFSLLGGLAVDWPGLAVPPPLRLFQCRDIRRGSSHSRYHSAKAQVRIPPGEVTMRWFRGFEAHRRSILKSISWRVLASVDTFVVSLVITHRLVLAGSIAVAEVLTKILLYYLHERFWAVIPYGLRRHER